MSAANAIVADFDRSPKLLLLDDDDVTLLLTAAALREQGFEIADCNDGAKALELLSHWIPDGVVVDALMPIMDGFEVCRRLRERPGFETVPILMLTALDDEASIAHAYEAGATDFFIKGPQWSLLAGRLRYWQRSSEPNATEPSWREHRSARMVVDKYRHGNLVLSGEVLRVRLVRTSD
jgi:DNA-binding response OmpR family regulator